MTLWYPAAILTPGPDGFVSGGGNRNEGVVEHSAEGGWSPLYRPADTMLLRRVSWHFTVFQDGAVEQHYPLSAECWHSGTGHNARLIGVEHEGLRGEALTEAQIIASVALTRWIAAQGKWRPSRGPGALQTLWEHREVNPRTTCPNGRIPWARYTVSEVDVITHRLTDTEKTAAARRIGRFTDEALSGTASVQDGRHVELIIDPDTPDEFVDYRVRLKKKDEED